MVKRCEFCGEMLGMFDDGMHVSKILMCESCYNRFGPSFKALQDAIQGNDMAHITAIVEKIKSDIAQSKMSENAKKTASEKTQQIAAVAAQASQTTPQPASPAADEHEGFLDSWDRESRFSIASGRNLPYVVLQVTLKEKFFGTGSGNLEDLEQVINEQIAKGYRLHTMSTSNGGSKGLGGGDRIQATLVFERLDITNGTYHPEIK